MSVHVSAEFPHRTPRDEHDSQVRSISLVSMPLLLTEWWTSVPSRPLRSSLVALSVSIEKGALSTGVGKGVNCKTVGLEWLVVILTGQRARSTQRKAELGYIQFIYLYLSIVYLPISLSLINHISIYWNSWWHGGSTWIQPCYRVYILLGIELGVYIRRFLSHVVTLSV